MKRLLIATLLLCEACSINSAKKHYVTAERLWSSKDYAASVREFERAFELDQKGKIGMRALIQAANTEVLFLKRYEQAKKKFERFISLTPDPDERWDAEKQIGDILYLKLEKHPEAIGHYEHMIKANPKSTDIPEFLFRQGRSRFLLKRFEDALATYAKLIREFPKSFQSERALYEQAIVYFTRAESGGRGIEDFQKSLDLFLEFSKKYPQSLNLVDAQFGMANCLEELGQLDLAYQAYAALKETFPSKQVIEIKMIRVRDRKLQIKR